MEISNKSMNAVKIIKKLFDSRRYRWLMLSAVIILLGALYIYHYVVPPVLTQSAIPFLNEVKPATQGEKILLFSPHPDDETIAVGGYLYESHNNGADVRIVLVTDGNYHHNENVRYSEFKKATGTLGIPENDLVFLNLPDSKLPQQNSQMLYNVFKQQVDAYNPDIVIYPSPLDYNPDHKTVGRIMENLLKADPQKRTTYEYLVHYEILYPRPREFNPGLYILPPDKLMTVVHWLSFPLLQNTEDIKQTAVFSYQSQLSDPWLKGLLQSYIRRNELLAVPNN